MNGSIRFMEYPFCFQTSKTGKIYGKVSCLVVNKILTLAGLTRARQCMGNNFAKGE